MANFRRRRPRTKTSPRGSTTSFRAKHGMKPVRVSYDDYRPDNIQGWREAWRPNHLCQMNRWPAWWDRLFHTRPKRVATKRLERAILRGADPDDLAWPLNSRKPHIYYW